jgi:transcription elongation factor Elf1
VPADDERTFQCPRCHQPTGRQDKFTLHERDKIKVIVRCGECRHRWSVIVSASEYSSVTMDRRD